MKGKNDSEFDWWDFIIMTIAGGTSGGTYKFPFSKVRRRILQTVIPLYISVIYFYVLESSPCSRRGFDSSLSFFSFFLFWNLELKVGIWFFFFLKDNNS